MSFGKPTLPDTPPTSTNPKEPKRRSKSEAKSGAATVGIQADRHGSSPLRAEAHRSSPRSSPDARAKLDADLARSGLTPAHAKAMGIELLSPDRVVELFGNDLFKVDGYLLPYFTSSGTKRPLSDKAWRIRLLGAVRGFAGLKKSPKYLSAPNTIPRLYFPPTLPKPLRWKDVLGEPKPPQPSKTPTDPPPPTPAPTELWIAEGEKKAARSSSIGIPTVGVPGAWSHGSKKASMPHLEEFDEIFWPGRSVVVAYDSDQRSNPQVLAGLKQLCEKLLKLGARPFILFLPEMDEAKVGLDDYIEAVVAQGKDPVAELRALPRQEYAPSKALWDFNADYCYVREPGVYLERKTGIMIRSFHKFSTELTAPITMTLANGKEIGVAHVWNTWDQRREHERFVFEPGEPEVLSDNSLNLWRSSSPLPTPPRRPTDLRPWFDFFEKLVPSAEERAYLEKWIAYPLQHPGAKMNVACVLVGTEQGTGKTLFGETVMRLYGENATTIGSADLTGRFNAVWAFRKQFVLGDEIYSMDRREIAEKLKRMITQREAWVEEKYAAKFSVRDCVNYLFTTNHLDALLPEESDRRLFVVKVTQDKQPKEFFDKLTAWLDDVGLGLLMHHLLSLDLADFSPYANAPMTDVKREMIYHSRSDFEKFAISLRDDPEEILEHFPAVTPREGRGQKLELFTPQDLMQIYLEWTGLSQAHHKVTAMGRALSAANLPSEDCHGIRLVRIRNRDFWLTLPKAKWREHYKTLRDLTVALVRRPPTVMTADGQQLRVIEGGRVVDKSDERGAAPKKRGPKY